MADERCGTCRFHIFDGAETTFGHCRRYPPNTNGHWPPVGPNGWCGEWKPRPTPVTTGRRVVAPAPARTRILEVARERR